MSSLSAFAAHARAMATAEHKHDCPTRSVVWRGGTYGVGINRGLAPPESCPGCVTDADRALWARLADEAEAYLSRHEEASLL